MFIKNGDAEIIDVVQDTDNDEKRESVLVQALDHAKEYKSVQSTEKTEN